MAEPAPRPLSNHKKLARRLGPLHRRVMRRVAGEPGERPRTRDSGRAWREDRNRNCCSIRLLVAVVQSRDSVSTRSGTSRSAATETRPGAPLPLYGQALCPSIETRNRTSVDQYRCGEAAVSQTCNEFEALLRSGKHESNRPLCLRSAGKTDWPKACTEARAKDTSRRRIAAAIASARGLRGFAA